jgi:hypothetical protein
MDQPEQTISVERSKKVLKLFSSGVDPWCSRKRKPEAVSCVNWGDSVKVRRPGIPFLDDSDV